MAAIAAELASRPAVVCQPAETVESVARTMIEAKVGCVVVIDDAERPIGIVTDRDLAVRVLAQGLPASTPVADVMTFDVVTVTESAGPLDAARQMEARECRRLPVLSDGYGHVMGVVSADDLLRLDTAEMDAIVRCTQGASCQRAVLNPRSVR